MKPMPINLNKLEMSYNLLLDMFTRHVHLGTKREKQKNNLMQKH